LLREALAADPNQPDFAVALARIHVERANLVDALSVLDAALPAAESHGELHVMRGTVLQRMGYHQHAADAYRAALRAQAGTPQVWLGLGISLEALQKRPEAAQAFRNALASGPVSTEVRTFAEQRIQALR
jgi:MSHA biogenesis protein MshN